MKFLIGLVVVAFLLGGFVMYAKSTLSTVRVERTFKAPVAKVWQIWTDAESMKSWWSPKDYTAPVIKHDFKVGGTFLYSMKSPKEEMHWNTGTYTEIVPEKKIVSKLAFSDENGRELKGDEIPVPGKWPDYVIVTVEFFEVDGGTRVTVEETGIPLIMKLFAGMGWHQQFDKMEKLL